MICGKAWYDTFTAFFIVGIFVTTIIITGYLLYITNMFTEELGWFLFAIAMSISLTILCKAGECDTNTNETETFI